MARENPHFKPIYSSLHREAIPDIAVSTGMDQLSDDVE